MFYRLLGCAIFAGEDDTFEMRFETFYEGKYMETYYVFISIGARLVVHKHTVPYFIDVMEMSRLYLNSDIKVWYCCFVDL